MKLLASHRRALVIALLIGILVVGTIFFLRGRAIVGLQVELKKVQAQQEKLAEETEDLKALFARKDDLGYIEYLARRELGLIRLGEEKYILIEREP